MHPIIKACYRRFTQEPLLPTQCVLGRVQLDQRGPSGPKSLKIHARDKAVYYHFTSSINLDQVALKATFIETSTPHQSMVFNRQGRYVFTQEDIEDFVEAIGDKNPLHSGDLNFVPGMLILNLMLEQGPQTWRHLDMKFKVPLYANVAFDVDYDDETACYYLVAGQSVLATCHYDL